MKRSLEFGLIIAVSALAVTSATTFIRDQNVPSSPVKQDWLTQGWHWVIGEAKRKVGVAHSAPANETFASQNVSMNSTSEPLTQSVPTSQDPQSTAPASTTSMIASGWTQQDLQQFQEIAQDVVSHLSQQDIQLLLLDLSSQDPQAAQTSVTNWVEQHVPSQDIQWFQARFQGREAFGPDDVALLQGAIAELENEFTPGEQDMLWQGLSHYLGLQTSGTTPISKGTGPR